MSTFHLILECSFQTPAGRAAGYVLQKSIAIAAGRAHRGKFTVLAQGLGEQRPLIERHDGQLDRSFKRRHTSVLACAATGVRRPGSFALRGLTIEDPMHEPLYAVASWPSKKVAAIARRWSRATKASSQITGLVGAAPGSTQPVLMRKRATSRESIAGVHAFFPASGPHERATLIGSNALARKALGFAASVHEGSTMKPAISLGSRPIADWTHLKKIF